MHTTVHDPHRPTLEVHLPGRHSVNTLVRGARPRPNSPEKIPLGRKNDNSKNKQVPCSSSLRRQVSALWRY